MTKIELVCPIIHGFVYHIENVGQTISDPGQKLIVYTLPSIWQFPFSQNDIKIPVFCQNRHPQKIGFVLYCIAYWYCLLAPVIPLWSQYCLLYRLLYRLLPIAYCPSSVFRHCVPTVRKAMLMELPRDLHTGPCMELPLG